MASEVSERKARRLLVEEAYALALVGLHDEALKMLDAMGPASPAERLCRIRIALAGGDGAAAAELAVLLEAGGEHAWRAAIDLARVARDEGRVADAATLLKRGIESFRAATDQPGPLRDRLEALLSAEVEAVRRAPSRPAQTEPPLPKASRLLGLIELGKRLATEDDPNRVLLIVLDEAIEFTATERGFVMLLNGDDLEFAVARNLDRTEIEEPAFEVSRTLIRGVVREGKPLAMVLPDEEDPDPHHRSLAAIGVRSVACVPILHDGQTLGVLYLDGRESSPQLTGSIERFLELLATQAGAALDSARTHRARSHALEAAEESLRRHRLQSARRVGYGELVGSSEAMQSVYRKLDRIAPTQMPLLILGETGTGKEVVARLVHSRGPRADREFVATNCAGMADTLLEAELFGHERGAFTGADRSRPGLFEQAHRGTLFLDEIGDMSPRMQADLLRVLQSGEVRRVGGRETFHVDVRVIAATHRDLETLQRRGEFRPDLYYRINVLSLELPPLRERAEDIALLVPELASRLTASGLRLSDRVMRRLISYSWPGNVRELQNVLRRMSVIDSDVIEEKHLPPELLRPTLRAGARGSLREAENDAVKQALEAARGNKTEAARILGVDRKTLYGKIKRLERDGEIRRDA